MTACARAGRTYLDATGLMGKTTASRIGERMRHRETLIGSSPRVARRRHGIRLRGRTVDVRGSEARFSDESRLAPRAVIWATGFTVDHSPVQLPVFDEHGAVVHERGVTTSPGLYFLGLPWQHTRGSALLGWVKDDAEHLVQHIAATRAATRARTPA
jgi:putative flavoprotein involved in K+ transport